MAHILPMKQLVVVLAIGILAAWLWVWLLGLWAVYDTPLLKLGLAARLGIRGIRLISLSLFALISALMFTVPLWLFFKHQLLPAAAVFVTAFLLCFVVPAAFD